MGDAVIQGPKEKGEIDALLRYGNDSSNYPRGDTACNTP